jgi:aldehyde:ferredoxin oxidoreductase
VKGLELTAFDPRGAFATALGYAVSNRGADYAHVYARHEFDVTPAAAARLYGDEYAADATVLRGKAEMVRRGMIVCAVLDALGICKVTALSLINAFDLEAEADLVREATGLDVSADDLWLVGERIVVAERLFNLACGAGAVDDRLPPVFALKPLTDGPARGMTVSLSTMLRDFYRRMGWTRAGRPTKATLRRLGLQSWGAHSEAPSAARRQRTDEPPADPEPVATLERLGLASRAVHST